METINTRRLSTRDIAYEYIKGQIINGDLVPDSPIIEDQVAKELSISRTPLREALQRLEFEGLISRQTNGRLKVSTISVHEVNEIFQVRSLLEGLLAREATLKASENDIKELRTFTKLIVEASLLDNRKDVVRYGSMFHNYLYSISNNQTAVKILLQLNDKISRYRRIGPIRDSMRSKTAAEEHQDLFNLIEKRDAIAVEDAMKLHINNSLKSAVKSIEEYIAQREEMEE
ncbi:GntR family transcriptional regulator [Robertmurraya kyonggiensis]|uniref:GntR family transcriptional regulator n=1 Tax=Robertmurraya kyonggiensis TaxID=1037680 RepID=A0A4V5P3Q0_9BACI|nr:GntR family transcriptional regulator [Robertmurraya kyonggiensis]TKC18010.1 GntR family transcriptional regulator [Robertmurraya kyonggiensis]